MGSKEKKEESLWKAVKVGINHIIRSETTSTKGRINLIFGVLLFLFSFACCIKGVAELIVDKIYSFISSKEVEGPSNWIMLFFMVGLIIYFLCCTRFVDMDTRLKKDIKEQSEI